MNRNLFTSESVTEGHPDKVCDQISDAILDDILTHDPNGRVACETLTTTGLVVISGEITSSYNPNYEQIIRDTIKKIGYDDPKSNFCSKTLKVLLYIDRQSSEIAQGVNENNNQEQGAGDQGLMFGYACLETPEFMPLPIQLSHRLTQRLSDVRKNKKLPWLRPDGKSQVTIEYDGYKPVSVSKVVIATQHEDLIKKFSSEEKEHSYIKEEVIKEVVLPVLEDCNLPYENNFIVNGTGRFVLGGPEADTGLTGRKIIVDTYGGYSRHGGGAFSGKDPSKVDRSASYMARYIAKNVVASNIAKRCEVQLAYSIGVSEPISVMVDTFGSSEYNNYEIVKLINKTFDLTPKGIIDTLDLKKPIYSKLGSYGHFGRVDLNLPWERTDKINELKKQISSEEHFG